MQEGRNNNKGDKMKEKQLYYDSERNQQYWIEWEETGNNDIPHRHYLQNTHKLNSDEIHSAIMNLIKEYENYCNNNKKVFDYVEFKEFVNAR